MENEGEEEVSRIKALNRVERETHEAEAKKVSKD